MQSAQGATRYGQYAVVRPLGQGGMACVYEAVHIGLGKRVALKVMQPHVALNQVTSARFVREGRVAARIRHPNVVDVLDVGTSTDGVPFLVMELLEGVDLSAFLRERRAMPLDEAIEILLPVLSAVGAAHAAGIVHRDLKPANILLARGHDGAIVPKVVDFGISTFLDRDGGLDLTQTDALLGTVRYMAPEQTRGAKFVEARSDLYSLGVILYSCVTGMQPYDGEGAFEVMHAIRTAPVPPPSSRLPGLAAAFDALVLRALAKEPEHRFASAQAFGRALLPFASRATAARWEKEFSGPLELAPPDATFVPTRSGDGPTAMSTVAHSAETRATRGPWRALTAGAIAFAVVGAIGVTLLRTHAPSPVAPQPEPSASAPPTSLAAPASASARSEPEPAAPVASQAASAPPAASAVATPSAKPSSAAPPPLRRALPPPRPTAPPAVTGKNGAPILE